jgi:hypothetical protein
VTAAAAEEHQGHQPAPDEKRKEGSETKSDPAVLIHHSVASRVPYRRSPEASEQEQDSQSYEKGDLAKAKASHVLRLLRLAPTGELNHQAKHPFLSGARAQQGLVTLVSRPGMQHANESN